jgi:hypothetical protein
MIKNIILILLLGPLMVFAQADFKFERTIKGDIQDFYVDNLNYIYLLSNDGQLKKLNPSGDSMAVFNNVRKYGKLHSVDVSNPLKILLYYKDFNTIVVLDRFLNIRTSIDLRKESLFQVKSIGQAYDNNIWIYDEQESKIKKVGDDGKIIDQFTDFRLLFDTVPSPQYIIDQDRQLYLYDPATGVFIFDYYGALKRQLPFKQWKDFAVINRSLFGRDDDFLYRYEPGTLNLQQFPLTPAMKSAKKVVVGQGKIYLQEDNQLNVFTF